MNRNNVFEALIDDLEGRDAEKGCLPGMSR